MVIVDSSIRQRSSQLGIIGVFQEGICIMDGNRQEHQQDTISGPGERTGYSGAVRRRGERAGRQQVQMLIRKESWRY